MLWWSYIEDFLAYHLHRWDTLTKYFPFQYGLKKKEVLKPEEDPDTAGRLGRKKKTPEEMAAEAEAAEEEEDSKFSSLCCCLSFVWQKQPHGRSHDTWGGYMVCHT